MEKTEDMKSLVGLLKEIEDLKKEKRVLLKKNKILKNEKQQIKIQVADAASEFYKNYFKEKSLLEKAGDSPDKTKQLKILEKDYLAVKKCAAGIIEPAPGTENEIWKEIRG